VGNGESKGQAAGRGGGEDAMRKLWAIVDVLAFFAARRNYSYVDALANALDPAVALETVYNAVRDFKSTCIDRRHVPCEGAEAGEVDARCPEVKPESLDYAVKSFAELTEKLYSEGRTSDLTLIYRRLAAEAMGRSLRYMVRCEGGGGAASQASAGAEAPVESQG